jgi:two-component system phosphate regulon sensor histidine kinase PhoR
VASVDRQGIPGTGLGLAIVKEIVEAHGGQLGVESAGTGRGSRFQFTLPVVPA